MSARFVTGLNTFLKSVSLMRIMRPKRYARRSPLLIIRRTVISEQDSISAASFMVRYLVFMLVLS